MPCQTGISTHPNPTSQIPTPMQFTAQIDVMPQKEILDPQGKAVMLGLKNLGVQGVENVRIGRHITLEFEATDEATAREITENACRKLLANLIMETYAYSLHAMA